MNWIDQIRKDLEDIGIIADRDLTNIIELAQDRNRWKTLTDNLHHGRESVKAVLASSKSGYNLDV